VRIVAFADTDASHARPGLSPGDVPVCAGDVCRAGDRDEPDDPVPCACPRGRSWFFR
jgi:hypothetical protein